jgi:hypothetical protein
MIQGKSLYFEKQWMIQRPKLAKEKKGNLLFVKEPRGGETDNAHTFSAIHFL